MRLRDAHRRNELDRPCPKAPAYVAVFVELLGAEKTATLLLKMGGAEVHYTANPTTRNRIVRLLGVDAALILARQDYRLPRELPVANKWLCQYLAWKGLSAAEIAQQVRVTTATVRRHLKEAT